jgi:hypothetical protein
MLELKLEADKESGPSRYSAQGDLSSKDSPDKDIALKIYEQKYNQSRHFDVLRWQVPGLVMTVGVLALRFGTNQNGSMPSPLLIGYGTFALFSAYFLYRLIIHIERNTEVLCAIGHLIGDKTIPGTTIWYRSAAVWFAILMFAVGAFALGVGVYNLFAR